MSTSLLNDQQKLSENLKIVAQLESGMLPIQSIENRARQLQSEYMVELMKESFNAIGHFLREYFVRAPIPTLPKANEERHDGEHPATA